MNFGRVDNSSQKMWQIVRLDSGFQAPDLTVKMAASIRGWPDHRIEINQKSDSRENLSMRMSKIRQFDAILAPSWLVPPALLTFKQHLPVTKADVMLTFCTYKVLYTKKAGGKNCRGN